MKTEIMKISFDFDGTLGEERMQEIAAKFIARGHEVWITTSRLDNDQGQPHWNIDLYSVAGELGIPKERVQLTNGTDKSHFLKDFDFHFDDDKVDIELIEENTNCLGILISRQ